MSQAEIIQKITGRLAELSPHQADKLPPLPMFKGTMDILVRTREDITCMTHGDTTIENLKPYCEVILMVLNYNRENMQQGISEGKITDGKMIKKLELKISAIDVLKEKLGDSWHVSDFRFAIDSAITYILENK